MTCRTESGQAECSQGGREWNDDPAYGRCKEYIMGKSQSELRTDFF